MTAFSRISNFQYGRGEIFGIISRKSDKLQHLAKYCGNMYLKESEIQQKCPKYIIIY